VPHPSPTGPAPRRVPGPVAAKVPAVSLAFWVVKVLTTGMGEAASDYLGEVSLVVGALVGVGGLALALWLQLRAPRYHAPTYWFAVAMVAVFGTMAADVLHVATGVSYAATTAVCLAGVAACFTAWHRTEGTLSIHSITTRRREVFYWATVLATFALGTAAGDLTADQLDLGFLASGLLFAAAMLVPALAWRLGASSVATFWTAYVLTRPLGASFADWFGKPPSFAGGLGYGDGTVTVVATAAIVVLVTLLAVTRSDVQPEPREREQQRVAG
jgi:uncharacterized membrane-anchored protein